MVKASYRARARKLDATWILDVPQVPGVFAEVSEFHDVEYRAREAIAEILDVPDDGFDLEVELVG